jgi:ubiquinone/menaquinone biosynthesis C-methylase UbiE
MRRAMFLSQDSVVICMTLRALEELDMLAPSLRGDLSLDDLGAEGAGFGALRIALHSLAGAGWLEGSPTLDPRTTYLRWTEAGRTAILHRDRYVAVADFLAGFAGTAPDTWLRRWSEDQADRFGELVGRASARWELGADQAPENCESMRTHLDLALVVPTMLWLHETGRVGGAGPEIPDDRVGEEMARLLTTLGWLDGESGEWTAGGRQARAFALNFGGVATYLPLLARLAEIYRGELTVAPDPDGGEWHVHRDLNLRISAAAHRRYFTESESIFVEIFERDPIEAQPRFIADMGCGDGSWLTHLYRLIERQTRRGRQLSDHPLTMIGVDPDAGAREMALRNLEQANAPAIVMSGDVTDPDRLQVDLAERGLQIEDGLHIRAFIDHERRYLGGESDQWVPGWTSGVYIDADGRPLSGEDIERDLIAALRRWEAHTRKHGLVVLEAHCVAPSVAFRHLGSLHGIAFDAHQAYSRQYPVDHASFLRCCQEAGLQSAGHCERRYPAGQPFVSIGLNRLRTGGGDSPLPGLGSTAPREDTWRPEADVDLEDGIALHDILFTRGDIRYPALWCSRPTGFVVAGALEAIERRLAGAQPGDTIRVMDYGAGTGTATIELLKACQERGIERRLDRLGAAIEVHLLDLPSSWFAQGYELLGDCSWTRFHSVRATDGSFRPIDEVVEGRTMDVVMANMVFHLIPPRALERSADGLAGVLAPDGVLVWSAPDLGPPGANSVLLHDPNRALRERWLELLADTEVHDLSPALGEALRRAREELDEESLQAAQQRADRRIRPRPLATEVFEALETRFAGEIRTTAFEMLGEDVVRGLLVPSNQAEYMPEIPHRELRESVIRELMLDVILPRMQSGAAGTSLGINLHWTLGKFYRRPR